MNWAWLSQGAQSALLKLCQSPSLSTLDIRYIIGLLPALFKNTHVRKLSVHCVSDHDYHTPVTELDFVGLEALDICITAPHFRINIRSLDLYAGTTNSRQLSLRTYSDGCWLMLETIHNVVEKASKTLKHVRWQNYRKRNRDLCATAYCCCFTNSNIFHIYSSAWFNVGNFIESPISIILDPLYK